jgi:hypothetical protein
MFEPGNDHLELLFEFGLGSGDGGPWKARMGDALDTPEQMMRGELRWALTHGMTERVRLLVDHGVDIASPFDDGVTPAGRRPRYPRSALRLHPARLGQVLRPGAARRAAGAAHRPGGTLITPRPDG